MTAETLATGYRSQAGFSLLKVLLAAVLFTMSWNDFLRLPYGLTVPNTLLALFIVLFTIRYLVEIDNARIYKRMFFYEESFLAVFFIFSVISYCINYEYSSISPILFFALAYLFFLSIRISESNFHLGSKFFVRISVCGVLFVSTLILFEFITRNVFGLNIQEYFIRTREATATFGVSGIRLFRPYALTTEPNIIAFYFNTFGVLSLSYILCGRYSYISKSALVSIFISSYVLIFSPTIIIMFSSIIVTFFLRFLLMSTFVRVPAVRSQFSFVLTAFIFVTASFGGVMLFLAFVLPGLMAKISALFIGEAARSEQWQRAFDTIGSSNIWFGNGPGYFSNEAGVSAVNWYLTLLGENGILGLLCILSFFFFILLRIARSQVPYAFAFTAGLMGGAAHLLTTSMFWNPYIWVLLGIFAVSASEKTRTVADARL